MENVLYAGFKGSHNSSFHLVSSLPGDKVFLTNFFRGILKDIESLDAGYKNVIMFGSDKMLKHSIRFELSAEKDSTLLHTRTNLSEYRAKAEKSALNYTISDRPTHYLCNEAYYQMMWKMDCPVIFVHIPTMKNISANFFEKLLTVFH